MEIAYTPAQAALRNELRAYYDEILDDETMREVRADSVGPTAERVWKQMCADGWAGHRLAEGVRRSAGSTRSTSSSSSTSRCAPAHRCRL